MCGWKVYMVHVVRSNDAYQHHDISFKYELSQAWNAVLCFYLQEANTSIAVEIVWPQTQTLYIKCEYYRNQKDSITK